MVSREKYVIFQWSFHVAYKWRPKQRNSHVPYSLENVFSLNPHFLFQTSFQTPIMYTVHTNRPFSSPFVNTLKIFYFYLKCLSLDWNLYVNQVVYVVNKKSKKIQKLSIHF